MFTKRCSLFIITAMTALLLAVPAMAQDTKTYVVLPFEYNGPKKFAYFPKAFQASLNSQLEWMGKTTPADLDTDGIASPKGEAGALQTLQSLGADYLVYGSISILGKDATVDMSAVGLAGEKWSQKGQMGIDEITPWLNQQSKMIMGDVFHRPGYGSAAKTQKEAKKQTAAVAGSNFIISAQNDGYTADTLNPQFRYEGGTQNIGRWRSQTMRFFSTSMVVGDGDGDGKNEVFILHNDGISAFRYDGGKLKPLDTFSTPSNARNLRVDLVDVNRDGTMEIVIAAYQSERANASRAADGRPRCHILSFADGKFSYVVKDYRKFLGVLRLPPTYQPVLVSQAKGNRDLFSSKVTEAYVKGDEIQVGNRIQLPPQANIYNTTYLPEDMGYRYVVIDDKNHLEVYNQTQEMLSSSEEKYNSSGYGIEVSRRQIGMGPGKADENRGIYKIPLRAVPVSLSQKGKYELLVNKDLSMAAKVFERFTYYSQGEIHSMVWDGVGMNLAWKTRRIKGQVSDLMVADINNDGKKQLCVLVNTFPGAVSFMKRKTVVLAYDLNTQ